MDFAHIHSIYYGLAGIQMEPQDSQKLQQRAAKREYILVMQNCITNIKNILKKITILSTSKKESQKW